MLPNTYELLCYIIMHKNDNHRVAHPQKKTIKKTIKNTFYSLIYEEDYMRIKEEDRDLKVQKLETLYVSSCMWICSVYSIFSPLQYE